MPITPKHHRCSTRSPPNSPTSTPLHRRETWTSALPRQRAGDEHRQRRRAPDAAGLKVQPDRAGLFLSVRLARADDEAASGRRGTRHRITLGNLYLDTGTSLGGAKAAKDGLLIRPGGSTSPRRCRWACLTSILNLPKPTAPVWSFAGYNRVVHDVDSHRRGQRRGFSKHGENSIERRHPARRLAIGLL